MHPLKKLTSGVTARLFRPTEKTDSFPDWVSYSPELIPSPSLMKTEGITILEEWYRWAEEWSMLLRMHGGLGKQSNVMEIGCGLGRIALPLRYIITDGTYSGFEICKYKVDFLQQNFAKSFPNFDFTWSNVHNTYYNPEGKMNAAEYVFPYEKEKFDLVYAASVFTHMLPQIAENYFKETARVLKKDGLAVFSFFLLDYYVKERKRPFGFVYPIFNFDHEYENNGDTFRIANPNNPEEMTAYKISLIEQFAESAGLELVNKPIPGLWSGSVSNWINAQDIVVLRKN